MSMPPNVGTAHSQTVMCHFKTPTYDTVYKRFLLARCYLVYIYYVLQFCTRKAKKYLQTLVFFHVLLHTKSVCNNTVYCWDTFLLILVSKINRKFLSMLPFLLLICEEKRHITAPNQNWRLSGYMGVYSSI